MDGTAPTADRLETLALDVVDESPTNPRKRFDQAKLEELAADIAANGLIQPVVVRPRGDGRFELVVGARRTRASKMAGRGTILAIVRDLDDRTTLEVQLSENAQRQDVHPLEEADGYAQLIEVHHATAEEVAAKVGKPVGYVRHRLQYRALSPAAREAFFAGKLTPHTALLVARIPVAALQEQATKEITAVQWNGGSMSPREAGEHVRHRFMLRLADAPFDRGDAQLVPAAGACTTCPKRTGNQAELFADVDSPDTCTDPGCFAAKKEAHWQQVTEKAKAKGQAVLSEKAAEKVFPYSDSVAHGSDYVDVTDKPWDVGDGKKSYEGLLGKDHLPPVTVARDKSGKVHDLVKKEDLARALKAAGLSSKAAAPPPSTNHEAQEREKKLRNRLTIDRAIAAIVPAAEARKPDLAQWVLVAEALLSSSYDAVRAVEKRRGIFNERNGGGAALKKALASMKEPQVRGLVVELIATKASVYAHFGEDFKSACTLLGVDLKKLEAAVSAERKAAKKAKTKKASKKSAKGASEPKAKPARARRAAEEQPDEEEQPDDGDLDGDPAEEEETETRVWVAMATWDALTDEAHVNLGEPIVGSEVGWHEIGEHMTAVVPGAELLEALRSECRKRGVALHEGEEPPAAAPTEEPARVPCTKDPAALCIPGRWVVVSLFAERWTRYGDSERRDGLTHLLHGSPGDHQTRLYDPDGEMVAWWPDGPRPPAIVDRFGKGPAAAVTLYVRDDAWQSLAPAAQRVVQSPAAGVSVLNIRPAGAAHREMGPMTPEEAEVLRAAARNVGLEVFDAPPAAGAKPEEPAPASAPQRVLIVHTEGDDWMGARKGLPAWQADKTPGAGFTTGGSAAPLAMLHTPAVDSADVAKLLARYQKAGRRVLDLGVVAGDKVFDCDPSNRAIHERWNVAHPHARVSVPDEPKPAKNASTKKGGR